MSAQEKRPLSVHDPRGRTDWQSVLQETGWPFPRRTDWQSVLQETGWPFPRRTDWQSVLQETGWPFPRRTDWQSVLQDGRATRRETLTRLIGRTFVCAAKPCW